MTRLLTNTGLKQIFAKCHSGKKKRVKIICDIKFLTSFNSKLSYHRIQSYVFSPLILPDYYVCSRNEMEKMKKMWQMALKPPVGNVIDNINKMYNLKIYIIYIL